LRPGCMRWIDRNFGRPLCFLFTMYERSKGFFTRSAGGPSRDGKISSVLFIKLIEQGSSVFASQAFEKAAAMAGRENLFCVVFRESRPILDILDVFPPGNIIEIDPSTPLSFLMSSLKAIRAARKARVDAAVDMEFFARVSAILAYLSGAGKRAGLHTFKSEGPYRGDLFTHRIVYNPYMHISRFFSMLVEALGHEPPGDGSPMRFDLPEDGFQAPSFAPGEDEKASLLAKIEKINGAPLSSPVFIFNPKTADLLPARKWPAENYAALGQMIMKRHPGAAVIVTGPPSEIKDNLDIASSIGPGAFSLTGKTTLRELLTLFCLADVLVASDCGPAIFSAMTPLRSVVLFGPESPSLYGIPGPGARVIYSRKICSPCVNVYNHRQTACGNAVCMTDIRPRLVFEAVEGIIDGE